MNAPFTPDDDIEVPVAPEGWQVDTEDKAAWALDRILEGEAALERLQAQFERNATRLQREIDRRKAFFGPQLEAWARAHPPKRGKTIHLATGDLAFRKVPGGLRVQDIDACIAWAEEKFPAAIARQVVVGLDKELIKRAAAVMFSQAVVESGKTAPQATSVEEAFALNELLMAAGAAALPPGVVRVDDKEAFDIKSPGGK